VTPSWVGRAGVLAGGRFCVLLVVASAPLTCSWPRMVPGRKQICVARTNVL
jgi:hypothetical protein